MPPRENGDLYQAAIAKQRSIEKPVIGSNGGVVASDADLEKILGQGQVEEEVEPLDKAA